MKKKDLIVIVILCILLGGGYLVYQMFQEDKDTVAIHYQNKMIETIDISKDQTYTYTGDYGQFSLEVKDHKYRATNVECPNHDCEKVGWVKEGSSKSILCVPNQIYIVQSHNQENY